MSEIPRPPSPWHHAWQSPLPEIPTLVHFVEAQAYPGKQLLPHRHQSFELCYIVSGRAHWTNTDGGYDLAAGDLYFTLPGEEHDGVSDAHDPHHCFAIGFDLRMVDPRLGDPGLAMSAARAIDGLLPRTRAIPGGQSTERIWIALRAEIERLPGPDDAQRPLAVAMIQALMVELAVSVSRLGIAAITNPQPALPLEQLASVCARLRRNLETPPSLAEMASWVSLSPGHFAILFKRAYQCTPHEYLDQAAGWTQRRRAAHRGARPAHHRHRLGSWISPRRSTSARRSEAPARSLTLAMAGGVAQAILSAEIAASLPTRGPPPRCLGALRRRAPQHQRIDRFALACVMARAGSTGPAASSASAAQRRDPDRRRRTRGHAERDHSRHGAAPR